jgi:hypothetical protein
LAIFRAALALDQGNVILALQVEPELRAVAEISPEADGGIGADRAASVENIGDAAGWNTEVESQSVRTQRTDLELAP